MIPEPNPSAALSSMEAETFRASFLRGRLLVLALVVMTAGGFFANTLHGYFTKGVPARLTDLLFGWTMVGFVCRCIYRGGPFASGCLVVVSAPLALGLVAALSMANLNIIVPFFHGSFGVNEFHDLGADWNSTISFLPTGAWAAYACWVLLVSKDARLYMRARNEQVKEAEASASAWPPPARHHEHSNDVP